MRYFIVLIPLLLLGCASSSTGVEPAPAVERKASVIFVGIPLAAAREKFAARNAECGPIGTFMWDLGARKEPEVHEYTLGNGRAVVLISAVGHQGRIVSSIRVSTYKPKSYECKMDPEYQKFFESFEDRKEFDLEDPMLVEPAAEQAIADGAAPVASPKPQVPMAR